MFSTLLQVIFLSRRARWKHKVSPATSAIIHNRTERTDLLQKKKNHQHPGTFELIPVLYFAARLLGNVVNNPSNSVGLCFYFLFCFYKIQQHVEFQFCTRTHRNQECSFHFRLPDRQFSEIKICKRPASHPLRLSIGSSSASLAGKLGISSGETHCERICFTKTLRLIS